MLHRACEISLSWRIICPVDEEKFYGGGGADMSTSVDVGGQVTGLSSPFTVWVLGIKLRSSCLAQELLPTEPSHQPKNDILWKNCGNEAALSYSSKSLISSMTQWSHTFMSTLP